jgi:hypothetical protein
MRTPRLATLLLAFAALLAAAGPLAAYTIYLKDGSRVVAKEKYTVQGDKAYIVLPSGTRTVIDANQIDVPRTDEANQADYGTALVLEGGEVKEMTKPAAAPHRKTLADLIASGASAPRELPEARRKSDTEEGPEGFTRTPGGFVDLLSVPRRPFGNLEIATALMQLFHGQGIDQVEIYQGTSGGRPLLDVTTNSEAAVFRALAVTCSALLHLRDRFDGRIEGVELVMTTPSRDRAGQFVLTPDTARQLMSKQVDIQTFYMAHVQF